MRSGNAYRIIYGLLIGGAFGSVGDRLPEFRSCVSHCLERQCSITYHIPLHRRALLWDCPAECDYECQHTITAARTAAGLQVEQFHGKWPFYRWMGIQEPASVAFSLLNWLTHYTGLRKVQAEVPPHYPLRKYYILLSYFGLAAWTFSTIFHTRDFKLTQDLDYFGAGAYVLYLAYLATVRLFRLDRKHNAHPRRLLTLVCTALYLSHVSYLSFIRFDFTYNMAANVVVGLIQDVLWLWFAVSRYRSVKQAWALLPAAIVLTVSAAMSLELLDFPPWAGIIDAHSLWHLATCLPTVWWYRFLVIDAKDDMATDRRRN